MASDESAPTSFAALIAPITPERFFAEYYRRKPLHLSDHDGRRRRIFSWARLQALIEQSALWSSGTMEVAFEGRSLDPKEWCYPGMDTSGRRVMLPDVDRLVGHLKRGATVTFDGLDQVVPEIRTVGEAIALATGGVVNCNAFCSFDKRRGYGPHFDTLEVFAVQIEGDKTWHHYEGRMPHAAEVPGFNCAAYTAQQREQMKGRVESEIALRPGDLLYVPQGQFHAALATHDSLHLSFGARHYTGCDVLNLLVQEVPKLPEFREALPHFADGQATGRYMARLGARLAKVFADPANAAIIQQFQKSKIGERMNRIALPERDRVERFRVAIGGSVRRDGEDWFVDTRDGAQRLPPAVGPLADWAAKHEQVTWRMLVTAFPDLPPAAARQAVQSLVQGGLFDPI